jgi:hypothetical protein
MSDNGPENLTLRYLRAVDERTERMERAMNRGFDAVAARLIGVEGRLLGLEGRITAIESWSADVTHRLERIERRLDLVETAP